MDYKHVRLYVCPFELIITISCIYFVFVISHYATLFARPSVRVPVMVLSLQVMPTVSPMTEQCSANLATWKKLAEERKAEKEEQERKEKEEREAKENEEGKEE